MPDLTKHAPKEPESPANWLTTSQAAALLKVSEKTVQRRAAAGKIPSLKETRETGVVLLVQVGVMTGDDTVTPPVVISDDRVTTPETKSDDRVTTGGDSKTTAYAPLMTPPVTTGDDSTGDRVTTSKVHPREVELLREQRQQDREEINFLRSLVEQRDRDAAELRAALREALRAMPKQLQAAAPEAPISTANLLGEPTPAESTKAPEIAPNRVTTPKGEMRPIWKVILGIR